MRLGKLIVGLGIGTVVGMLIAPKKGSELVEDINTKVKDVKNNAKDFTKEDLIAKFNELTEKTQDAIKNFDPQKTKETTQKKLESLASELNQLKTKVVESDQWQTLSDKVAEIASKINDLVNNIIDEVTEEISEDSPVDVEEEIDDTAKEIEELIQEINTDQDNVG